MYYRDQLWTAPELLRMTTNRPINGYCYRCYYHVVCSSVNSTYQWNSEGRRLQLCYHPAGDHVQSGALLRRHRSPKVYVAGNCYHGRSWLSNLLMVSICKMGGLFLQLKYRHHAKRLFLSKSPPSCC